MDSEEIIRKRLKKLKEANPDFDVDQLERELIPLSGKEVKIKTVKRKKRA